MRVNVMTMRRGRSLALFSFPLFALVLLAGAAASAPPPPQLPIFTPMPGLVPEGVAVDKTGTVYVSVREGALGSIWRFVSGREGSWFADVGLGEVGGLAVTADGTLYVAMAIGPDQGIHRVGRDGTAERLEGSEQIVFANALAFDHRGTLYVTESYSIDGSGQYAQGGIWRIARGGDPELWLRHELLTGIGAVLGYPVGANGIACYHGDLYVANTDKGIVVRVPILVDGSPGQPEVWAPLQEVEGSPLAGSGFPLMGDGLALDVHGNVYVAVVSRCAVVRISAADRAQDTVAMLSFAPDPPAPAAPFDTPASLAFGTGKGMRTDLFVTNLGWMENLVPGPPWPGPGLVQVEAGAPGLPLP
jgi:sugar lactone lactonase YvrE